VRHKNAFTTIANVVDFGEKKHINTRENRRRRFMVGMQIVLSKLNYYFEVIKLLL